MNQTCHNGISIIICCYNSGDLLPQTLKHIARQKIFSRFKWELIIVNNNSADDTVEVAKIEWAKYPGTGIGFRIIDEVNPGLTNARKKGISEAAYEYLIFCDDDNWLNENYLENAYAIMEGNKQIGALGGVIDVVSNVELPGWWEEYRYAYAVGRQAAQPGELTNRKYVWGAGMVIRKKPLEWIFNPDFPFILADRKGAELGSGGDSEICARLLIMGYKLWYDESLSLVHYIPGNRLSFSYREEMMKGHKLAQIKLNEYYRMMYFGNLDLFSRVKQTIRYTIPLLQEFFVPKVKGDRIKAEIGYMWNIDFTQAGGVRSYLFRLKHYLIQNKR